MASTSSHSLLTLDEAREEVMSSGTLFGVSPTLQLLNEHRGVAASPADAAALTPTQAKLRRATAQNGPSLRLQREQDLTAATALWQQRAQVREEAIGLFELLDPEGDFALDWRSYRDNFGEAETHLALFLPDAATKQACLCQGVRVVGGGLAMVVVAAEDDDGCACVWYWQDLAATGPSGSPERAEAEEAFTRPHAALLPHATL